MNLQKQQRHESKRLRDSARGRDCMIRIPGICNFAVDTTVLCHLNGAGAGTKRSDLLAAFGCSACHDAIDGRTRTQYTRAELELMHLQGVIRTQQAWLDDEMVVMA